MVDNFDIIKPLLKFEDSDRFYFVSILLRKKDSKGIRGKVNGTNNNSRLIKAYFVHSMEYLEFITPEVKELCKLFNARAMIHLQQRSYRNTAFKTLGLIASNIQNFNFNKIHKCFTSACGKGGAGQKYFLVDVDDKKDNPGNYINFINNFCEPEGYKFVCKLPSKNGYHLVCDPFNVKKFRDKFPEIDIQKNNPTNLFIP